ncbi:MAG: metal ABC transporter ATP-binding protein [Ilumatobacter sp.]
MPAARRLVSFYHVGCAYGATVAVEDTSFCIVGAEFVGIVGPSGSGKTTVLKALLGIVDPVYGRIERSPDLRVAYVPQVEAIDWSFPATVADVVTMSVPRPRFRRADPEFRARIAELLDRLGLGGLHDRHIRELSGGQQQRVFIARALAQRPELLVLDEPASGVDVATRHEMLHVLSDLHRDGMAIVLTTHDINGLAAHLPRVICFNRTVIADGAPGDVLHPYVLERTYGAPMQVLQHGGMPLVVEHRGHGRPVAGGAADPRPPAGGGGFRAAPTGKPPRDLNTLSCCAV